MRKWMLILSVIVLSAWGGCEWWKHKQRFAVVPDAMGVTDLLYQSEGSWGFGPGGNETGIRVFEMPQSVVDALAVEGLAYLSGLPRGEGSHNRYDDWRATPVAEWTYSDHDGVTSSETPGIEGYLFRYGHVIPVDPAIEKMVDDALFSEGAFYAHGRSGMILLIPAQRRIVYAYSG